MSWRVSRAGEPIPEAAPSLNETLAAARAAIGKQDLLRVFELWMAGLTQPEIACTLNLSVTTVGRRMAEVGSAWAIWRASLKRTVCKGSLAPMGVISEGSCPP